MILLLIDKIGLRNFRSHETTDINFGQGITVIVGENGAGKTSILEAVGFALFKEKPEGVSMDELITLGKNDGEVSLRFRSDGRQYLVKRKREVGRGSDSNLYRLDDDTQTLLVKGEREVTIEVEKILGINGELFTSAVYIRQGEIDRLLSSDPSTRKRHVGKLIGTEDLESVHRRFLEVIQVYEGKARELSLIPEELSKKKESFERKKAELKGLVTKHEESEKMLAEKKDDAARLRERYETLVGLTDTAKEAEKDGLELSYLEKDIERITMYEREIKETEEDSRRAYGVEQAVAGLKKEISGFDFIRARLERSESELSKLKMQLQSLDSELKTVFSAASRILDTQIPDAAVLKKQAEKTAATLRRRLDDLNSEKESLTGLLGEKNSTLDAVRKAAAELEEAEAVCPVCRKELDPAHKRELAAKYLEESTALSDEIESLVKGVNAMKKEILPVEETIGKIASLNIGSAEWKEKSRAELYRDMETSVDALKNDVAAMEGLPPLKEKQTELEKELERLKPIRDRHVEAVGFLRKNLSHKEQFRAKAKKLKKETDSRRKDLSERCEKLGVNIELLPQIVAQAREREQKALESLMFLEKNSASQTSAIREKEKRLSELKEEIKENEERVKELKRLTRFKSFLEEVRAVFHKDALQKQLRLRARPLIEDYTRDVFMNFNLPYSDVSLTEDFNLKVRGMNGEESLEMLSGGERMAAALALRVGLSRALSGPVMELIILDEPTIHLDAQRRKELVDVIKRLATIPQTIVVTHDKEFEEAADTIIEVEKRNGVSIVS